MIVKKNAAAKDVLFADSKQDTTWSTETAAMETMDRALELIAEANGVAVGIKLQVQFLGLGVEGVSV